MTFYYNGERLSFESNKTAKIWIERKKNITWNRLAAGSSLIIENSNLKTTAFRDFLFLNYIRTHENKFQHLELY